MADNSRELDFFRLMCRIRLFEERVDRLFAEGKMDGTTHLSMGQEACAVGAVSALEKQDHVVSNHRGHGHILARGAPPDLVMAELMGKRTGLCAGRGGSQHMCAVDIGFLGTNGITGGGIPIATGAALSAKYKGESRVVLCFFGDGAANQGTFHESLNMAALWSLPIVYFCENNLYGMSTHVSRATKSASIADRAAAYGMPGTFVDGMDVLAVNAAAAAAVSRARKGEGPTLIEARTYRFCGHSKSDRCLYRSREEEAGWRKRDPLIVLASRLLEAGTAQKELERVRAEESARIEAAVRFAEQSEFPDPRAAAQRAGCDG